MKHFALKECFGMIFAFLSFFSGCIGSTYNASDLPSIKMYNAATNDNVMLAMEAINAGESIDQIKSDKVSDLSIKGRKESVKYSITAQKL